MSELQAAVHFERGLEAQDADDWERAIREYRTAVERDSEHCRAHQQLGWLIYGTGGDLEEARASLQRAIEIEPSLGDAHLYLGLVTNRLELIEASEAHYREALRLSEDPALVHTTFASEFLWAHSRYGEAEEHFEAALAIDPDFVLALRDYARMLSCHGRDEEARPLFEKAIALDPDGRYNRPAYEKFLEDIASKDRNPEECLRAAVERDPNYSGGIESLARYHS